MKVLVTGASGYIGRYVVAELLRQDHEVIGLSRHGVNSSNPATDRAAKYLAYDISSDESTDYFSSNTPDMLIHLAWSGLPNYYSLHHYEFNLPSSYKFIKSMIGLGVKKVLVAGTCLEYGMQYGPLSEDTETLPCVSYALAKDVLRRQLEFLRGEFDFTLLWARLFYIYGEGQGGKSMYQQLEAAVLRGDREFKLSGGQQLRDYLTVETVANLLVRLAATQRDYGRINICSGVPVSIRSLVETWVAERKWNIELSFGHYPYKDYEPMAFWGDRTRLDSALSEMAITSHE